MGCVDVNDTVHMVRLRCICLCDVTHEWVPNPLCAIVMCDSNIYLIDHSCTNSLKGSFARCNVWLRFLKYRNWIVWMLMTLFTWCDLLCMWCILVCDVAHEWVPYLFCAIVVCDSYVNTLQITSKPITLCEQIHKNACIKLLSHTEQIAPCEWTLNHKKKCHCERNKSHRVNEPWGCSRGTIIIAIKIYFSLLRFCIGFNSVTIAQW